MRPVAFSRACLAPLTLSLIACSGGTDRTDDDITGPRDAGENVTRDAGNGVIRDGGPRDGGGAPRDGGFRDGGPGAVRDGGFRDGGVASCDYPANPAEPMALNQPLFPYAWPQAIDGNDVSTVLDLHDVFCNSDGTWGDVDALLFVSLDAW
ncbi:MAG: hypothetical protein RIT81_19330 [Deltaproteobacteria bacterium]